MLTQPELVICGLNQFRHTYQTSFFGDDSYIISNSGRNISIDVNFDAIWYPHIWSVKHPLVDDTVEVAIIIYLGIRSITWEKRWG